MDGAAFERSRLDLFHRAGFAGESRRFEDGPGRATYAVVRERGGRPTILVHGGLAEASVWTPLAGLLPGTVVIPDRPGHGLSTTIDYDGLDYRAAAVAWMKNLVDALGAPEVDLVGNSMGGFFSIVFALAYPERVRRVALVGAPAGLDRELPLMLRLWGQPVVGAAISKMVATTREPEQLRDRVYGPLCAHPERVSDEALRIAGAATSKPGWDVTVRSMLRAVTDAGGWRPALSIREDSTKLRVPTLFAWGDKDAFAPPSSGQAVAARMADARFDVIADAGHIPHLDQPEAVASVVRDFLGAADATAAAAQ